MDTDVIAVPSGKPVTLLEIITDQPNGEAVYRFRFVAPHIARSKGLPDADIVETDMAFLCRDVALPRIADSNGSPGRIVISLSDRPTEFGTPAPEATQFFEAYTIDGNDCIWEPF